MTSPADRSFGPDEPGFYAPKWVRERGTHAGETMASEAEPYSAEIVPLAPERKDDGRLVIDRVRVPRSLEPGAIPEPVQSVRLRSPLALWGRLGAAFVVAATVALAVVGKIPLPGWTESAEPPSAAGTMPFSSRFAGQATAPADSAAPAKLTLHDRAATTVGDAARLGVSVSGGRDNAIVIAGLPAGATLSAGYPYGAGGWRLPASDVEEALVYPPRGFTGMMDLGVELRRPDDSLSERRTARIEWKTKPPAPPAPQPRAPQAAALVPAATPPVAPAPSVAAAPPTAAAAPVAAAPPTAAADSPARLLSSQEIDVLVSRAEEYLGTGDLVTARVLLKRAAEARDPRAAFTLASTYDPMVLEKLRVVGFAPDLAMARTWYEKAKEFGSAEAPRRLEMLASRSQ